MATIVTRSGKGSPLTNNEVDANFNNLNTEVGAALPKAGGAMTGAITTNSTIDGRDVAADGVTADAALPKSGGAMTGAITTNSTFDGVDIATRDAVLTNTTTTANAALPKAGGAMTGAITTNSTFDGRDVAADGVTADAALPKAGGALSGAVTTNSTFDGRDVAADGVTADAALPKAGGAMTGAITTNSTFDGRDVATDGTKLDGVEASADVTDTANVTSAGALMDSELTSIASVKALNQGVATGNSPTFVDVTATSLDISGNIDVDGVTNLDVVDIDGAVDMASTLAVGSTLSSGDITIAVDDTPTLNFKKASSADVLASINVTTDAGSGGKLVIQTKRNGNTPVDRLTIDDDGAATFSSTVAASGAYTSNMSGGQSSLQLEAGGANKAIVGLEPAVGGGSSNDLSIYSRSGALRFWANGAEKLTIATNGAATFSGVVTANAELNVNGTGTVAKFEATDGAAYIQIKDDDGTSGFIGVDAGIMKFQTPGSSFSNKLTIGSSGDFNFSSGGVINESGSSADFRVESDTNTHMLFVDGGNNRVGIGAVPRDSAVFDVQSEEEIRFFGYTAFGNFASNNDVMSFNTQLSSDGTTVTPYYTGAGSAGISFFHMDAGGGGAVSWRSATTGTSTTARAYTTIPSYMHISPTGLDTGAFVINEDSKDIDFRVESDESSHMLFVDAGANKVGINTVTPAYGKLVIHSNADGAQLRMSGNAVTGGSTNRMLYSRQLSVVSAGNKLIIPFVSQGNLNSTTICKVFGHSARYNLNAPLGFEATFAVGHLAALANLESWGLGGNAASVAVNGMNVEITFSSAYTYGTANGIYVTLEYMTNVPSYSIDESNLALN